MKKIIFILILFPSIAFGATLSFTAGTTDKVTVTNPQTFGAGSEYTYWMWFYKTSDTAGQGTGKGGTDVFVNGFIGTDDAFANTFRASINSEAVTNANAFPQNVWTFVAVTYSEADGQRIFRGTLTSLVSELSYLSRTAGLGNTSADTNNLFINNRSAVSTASIGGRIAVAGWISRRLNIGEIRSLQFFPRKVADTQFFGWLGFNGLTNVPDWSGNGRTGVITGTTLNLTGLPVKVR